MAKREDTLAPLRAWVLQEMELRGWNQNDLSAKTRFTPGTISLLLNGQTRNLSLELAQALADAFGVPVWQVLTLAGVPGPTRQSVELAAQLESLPPDVRDPLLEFLRLALTAARIEAGLENHDTLED